MGADLYYRAVHKRRPHLVLPFPLRFVDDRLVPVKTFRGAARWPWLARLFIRDPIEFLRHKMIRIPKLFRPRVWNSPQSAPAWCAPVRRQDRLPNHQHSELRVGVLLQDLFGCGGPPQTCHSGWRQQQNQARAIHRLVKRILELRKVTLGKRSERLLPGWHCGSHPQIRRTSNHCRHQKADGDRLPLHFADHANRSARKPAISCGNKIMPTTSASADHNNTTLK